MSVAEKFRCRSDTPVGVKLNRKLPKVSQPRIPSRLLGIPLRKIPFHRLGFNPLETGPLGEDCSFFHLPVAGRDLFFGAASMARDFFHP